MRLNFTENSFVFGRVDREIAPKTFSVNLARRELPKYGWTSRKTASFLMHKSWKCVQNFFCKTCRRRSSKLRLNFTENSYVPGRINRENASRTFFINLTGRKIPNGVWSEQQTASFLEAKIDNMPPEFFTKLARRKLTKCVWTSQQISSFLDAKIKKMRAETFYKLASGEFPNCIWTFFTAHCFISMLWPGNGLNRENASRTSFKT